MVRVAAMSLLRWLLSLFARPVELSRPWLVDRDGRVYLPERRVVLKAKA